MPPVLIASGSGEGFPPGTKVLDVEITYVDVEVEDYIEYCVNGLFCCPPKGNPGTTVTELTSGSGSATSGGASGGIVDVPCGMSWYWSSGGGGSSEVGSGSGTTCVIDPNTVPVWFVQQVSNYLLWISTQPPYDQTFYYWHYIIQCIVTRCPGPWNIFNLMHYCLTFRGAFHLDCTSIPQLSSYTVTYPEVVDIITYIVQQWQLYLEDNLQVEIAKCLGIDGAKIHEKMDAHWVDADVPGQIAGKTCLTIGPTANCDPLCGKLVSGSAIGIDGVAGVLG